MIFRVNNSNIVQKILKHCKHYSNLLDNLLNLIFTLLITKRNCEKHKTFISYMCIQKLWRATFFFASHLKLIWFHTYPWQIFTNNVWTSIGMCAGSFINGNKIKLKEKKTNCIITILIMGRSLEIHVVYLLTLQHTKHTHAAHAAVCT